MREILFRGKRVKNREWVYGDLEHGRNRDKGKAFIWEPKDDVLIPVLHHEVISETVGQFTNLVDTFNNPIYEGDIVEFVSHGYIRSVDVGIVVFKDGCYGIDYITDMAKKYGWSRSFHRIGSIEEWQEMGASGKITFTYKVIGNIHDNPELLEGEENE